LLLLAVSLLANLASTVEERMVRLPQTLQTFGSQRGTYGTTLERKNTPLGFALHAIFV
jgi:hypothetical protein